MALTQTTAATPAPTGTARTSTELAKCLFDSAQATTFLAQAGVTIDEAVSDCNKEGGTLGCVIDILSVVSSFGFAAAYIAGAVAECKPEQGLPGASALVCGSAIAGLVGAVLGLGASGTGIAKDCGEPATAAPAP